MGLPGFNSVIRASCQRRRSLRRRSEDTSQRTHRHCIKSDGHRLGEDGNIAAAKAASRAPVGSASPSARAWDQCGPDRLLDARSCRSSTVETAASCRREIPRPAHGSDSRVNEACNSWEQCDLNRCGERINKDEWHRGTHLRPTPRMTPTPLRNRRPSPTAQSLQDSLESVSVISTSEIVAGSGASEIAWT